MPSARIITTHTNSDFDALASVVAGGFLYPGALGVMPAHVRPNVRAFLSLHKDLFRLRVPKETDLGPVQGLVVVDAGSWSLLEGMDPLKAKDGLEIFLWDHHAGGGDIVAAFKRVEETGANITLMVREMRERDCAFAPMHATLFLMGLYEDTGSLSFPSTRPEDAACAAFLLENGADLNVAGAYLAQAFDQSHQDALAHILQSPRVINLGPYKVAVALEPVEAGMTMLSTVVARFKEILGVDAAFGVFFVGKEKTMVIGRGAIHGFDVGAVVRALGGGGHPGAGSAMVRSLEPEAVFEKLMDLIREMEKPDVPVKRIMSAPLVIVAPGTPARELILLMDQQNATAALVMDKDQILGVVSRAELRKARTEPQLRSPAKAFLKAGFPALSPDQGVREAARLMAERDAALLPVLDKGALAGVVTRADILLEMYEF